MMSLLKKLSIFIKNWCNQTLWSLVSFKIVDRIRRQSSSASCELCSHRRRRRDKTVSSRRRCVLGFRRRPVDSNRGARENIIAGPYYLLPFCMSWDRGNVGRGVPLTIRLRVRGRVVSSPALSEANPGPKMDFMHILGQKEATWNTIFDIFERRRGPHTSRGLGNSPFLPSRRAWLDGLTITPMMYHGNASNFGIKSSTFKVTVG